GELSGEMPPRNLPPLAGAALQPLRELLGDPAVLKAGHNIKSAWQVLRRAGVELRGVTYDTQLAAFVLDPGRRSFALDELARERVNRGLRSQADLLGRGRVLRSFAAVPVPEAGRYTCDETEAVLALRDAFGPELEDHRLQPLLDRIEVPLIPVLVEM